MLIVISAFIRSRTLGGQLWFDEGIATGMASHSLSSLPGILRQAGAAPLYYVLLHFWIDVFGSSESTVHALSLAVRRWRRSRPGCGRHGACSGAGRVTTPRFCSPSARS